MFRAGRIDFQLLPQVRLVHLAVMRLLHAVRSPDLAENVFVGQGLARGRRARDYT